MSTSFPPIIHMFSTGWFRLVVFASLAAGVASSAFAGAIAGQASDVTLYRVFLRDGSTLVSYGEFARVGDRVVVTLPIGGGEAPDLQLLSLPADTVDWEKTDAYADSARAMRYAQTHGPNDFANLTNAVTITLNDIAVEPD